MSEPRGVVNAGPADRGPAAHGGRALSTSAAIREKAAPRAVMYAYPWDVYDHGPQRVLDDLAACGIDALQLSFSYHVATFITPRNPRRKVRFGEPGALEFDPTLSDAVTWPFEPAVAAEVTGETYMPVLLEAVAERGIAVSAWVVYLYNHALARRNPELAVVNAFGDRNGAQLCPANPAVREYVLALTDAVLAHGPLTGLVTESLSYLPYDYGFLNLKAAVTPSEAAGLLLSLCFCSHCAAGAAAFGIDPTGWRQEVAATIEREFAYLPDGSAPGADTEAWCRDSSELQRFLEARAASASSLQQTVLHKAKAAGLRAGTNAAEAQDERLTGVPNSSVAALRSDFRFEVMPHWSMEETQLAVSRARAAAGPDATVYALAQLSNFPDERAFGASLEAVAASGIEHFRLYEYGLLAERHLAWLEHAQHLWTGAGHGPTVSGSERKRTDG